MNCWTGVVWIIVMFLSAVWALILTAPIHCRGSIGEQVMLCNIFPNLFWWNQTHLHLGWPDCEYIYSNFFYFGWTIPSAKTITVLLLPCLYVSNSAGSLTCPHPSFALLCFLKCEGLVGSNQRESRISCCRGDWGGFLVVKEFSLTRHWWNVPASANSTPTHTN